MYAIDEKTAALTDRLHLFLDRAEIRDLVDRFVVALDTQDERGYDDDWYRTVFTDDVRLTFPINTHHGIDGLARFESAARARWARTHHLASTPEVEVSGDEATVRTQVIATHVHPPEDSDSGRDPLLRVGGHYDARAVRTDDGWRLSELAFEMVWWTGEGPRGAE